MSEGLAEAPRWRVDGAFVTHVGNVRTRNEDVIVTGRCVAGLLQAGPEGFALESEEGWLVAVVDGMGGHAGGDVAARAVGAALLKVREFTVPSLQAALCAANEELFSLGADDPLLVGCGATVAGLFDGPTGVGVFHIGDCRVYRQQDGYLAQLTQDDSVARLLQQEIDYGERGAMRNAQLHELTQAIGGRKIFRPIQPHVKLLRVTGPTRFLICSDGLTDMVPLDTLELLYADNTADTTAVDALLMAALDSGGHDNISIISCMVIAAP